MSTSSEPLIRLADISKVYSTDEVDTSALANVSLEISEGEFVAVTGPSGCGKTTLLQILGLLDSPTSGEYLLEGIATKDLSVTRRAQLRNKTIGFIFQSFNLVADMRVVDNVALPLAYRGIATRERRERALDALATVGLPNRARHYPSQLSGGQQQRVAVARALVGSPSVLLADEPTGNLDSKNANGVMQLLIDLHANGTTICMVTHDEKFAAVAESTINLKDGALVGRM